MASATEDHRVPAARRVAEGDGWRVNEIVCSLGPHDRAFEERHDDVTIAIVLAGSFLYRSENGRSLMYPGSLLLGNAGAGFECGHDHGTGDHCLSFHFSKGFFAEMAAALAGSSRFRFPATMLPALRRLAGLIVRVEAGSRDKAPLRLEELSIELAEGVLATLAGGAPRVADPPARDQRRISDAVRYIEESADEPLGLGEAAQAARMSRYHFLRTFRRTLGVTPYQFLLNRRMHRAAMALKTSAAPVAAVAFASGFGDLSTFNARFREVIGMTPQAFRRG
ncbi:MAG: helix-turn-helix domain-containing protein [Parvibaculaceae bacterium]